MAREDLPTVVKRWECQVNSSFDLVTDEVWNFLIEMHDNTPWPPVVTPRANNNWCGYFIYFKIGIGRHEKDLIIAINIRRDGPSNTKILIDEFTAILYQSRTDELSQVIRSWINEQYNAAFVERKPQFDSPLRMQLAPLEPRLIYVGIVDLSSLENWFFDICDQYIDDDWMVHKGHKSWRIQEKKIAPFWRDKKSIVEIVELGAVPVLQIRTEPISDAQFRVEISDFQNGRFDPPLEIQIKERFSPPDDDEKQEVLPEYGDKVSDEAGSDETNRINIENRSEQQNTDEQRNNISEQYKSEKWYKGLTLEEKQRYDLLLPYKSAWEKNEITNSELAKIAGKESDTVRGWRRNLRKAGAPNMDWKKKNNRGE